MFNDPAFVGSFYLATKGTRTCEGAKRQETPQLNLKPVISLTGGSVTDKVFSYAILWKWNRRA
jgi:hypothetical protein